MERRDFLKVAGAFATIEIEPSDTIRRRSDRASAGDDDTSFVASLPGSNALAASDYAFSMTRLDDDVATVTENVVSDATVYGTVFAGRVMTDIAFGLGDADAFRNRLVTDGYDVVGVQDGWTLFERELRTRHRVVAVTDSTAVVGVGPALGAVRNDVTETLAAVTDRPAERVTETGICRAVLDHLGSGIHLSVDMTPDPRRTRASVEATGERYAVRDDTMAVRHVTLFDTPSHARTASREDLGPTPVLQSPAATDCSSDCHGRAIVRDTTIPSAAFPSRP